MKPSRFLFPSSVFLAVLLLAFVSGLKADGDKVRVAAASNFLTPLRALAQAFEAETGHPVQISSASSGKLFAQISNGAPFDIFLSADQEKAAALVAAGLARADSRFTYALGRLVLWSPKAEGKPDAQLLRSKKFNKLSVANPRLAPYGQAAIEVLSNLSVYDSLGHKIVMGENIAQTWQFVATGNAELGMVALSQVIDSPGSYWQIPSHLYTPISQDAVLLNAAADSEAARKFLCFLKSDKAQAIIAAHGYRNPSPPAEANAGRACNDIPADGSESSTVKAVPRT